MLFRSKVPRLRSGQTPLLDLQRKQSKKRVLDTVMQPGKLGECQKTEYERSTSKPIRKRKGFLWTYWKYSYLMILEHM